MGHERKSVRIAECIYMFLKKIAKKSIYTCAIITSIFLSWKSINKHPDDGMPPMKSMRDRAAAVVNDHGNMWVLGGRDEVEEGLTSTEIYKYKRNGKGKWRKGPNLPSDLPAGLSSHCAVR